MPTQSQDRTRTKNQPNTPTPPRRTPTHQALKHLQTLTNNGNTNRLIAWLAGIRLETLTNLQRTGRCSPQTAQQILTIPTNAHQHWKPRSDLADILSELRHAHIPPRWYSQQLGWGDTEPNHPPYIPVSTIEQAWQLYRRWLDGHIQQIELDDGTIRRVKQPGRSRPANHPFLQLAEILEERNQRTWRTKAECVIRKTPTSQFFADEHSPGARETMMRTAGDVCAVCQVQNECLEALGDLDVGLVGSLTVTQRRQLTVSGVC